MVGWLIKANLAHSALLQDLSRQYPQVCLVDTRSNLDGLCQNYIDLAHLTQECRRQLAENMFAGFRDLLEKELKPVRPE